MPQAVLRSTAAGAAAALAVLIAIVAIIAASCGGSAIDLTAG